MTIPKRSVHAWTDWDFIDWMNAQAYSAQYDAWFEYQCKKIR